MSATAMSTWPIGSPWNWNYEQGLILRALQTVWERTNNPVYYNYVKGKSDYFVTGDGNINTYDLSSYNLDNIASGKAILFLYRQTGLAKYKLASDKLRSQLATHPRTSDGGFWHKKIYPYQMWLDGLFMAGPFYAEYSSLFSSGNDLNDVAKQFILMEKHARNTSTGLLYHGWDESKAQAWAHPLSGCSPNYWGRALGWYAMGLVDVIEFFPETSAQRDTLLQIWRRLSVAIIDYQNASSGLWYQVLDKQDSVGNYPEASASCMLVYALAKATRLGYNEAGVRMYAERGYIGILRSFVTTDAQGKCHLGGICPVAGLGGTPYRDGSYGYYVGVKGVQDDPKGIGAFILAAIEMERTTSALSISGPDQALKRQPIKLYPNPVEDILYIHLEMEEEIGEICLSDLSGRNVYIGLAPQISLQGLARGLYLLQVRTKSGKTWQETVVKQ